MPLIMDYSGFPCYNGYCAKRKHFLAIIWEEDEMKREFKSLSNPGNEILGFRASDLLGIAIMVIPFMISIYFSYNERADRILGLIPLGTDKTVNIHPSLISTLCAVMFYAPLVVRYKGVFRAGTMVEAVISCIRTAMNCWVIASLIQIPMLNTEAVSAKNMTLTVLMKTPGSTLLLFAILLSWLGMKTIAGYSWVLFIIAAWKNMHIVNSAMGMLGAVFILTITISLFLQIKDYSAIREFMSDFRSSTSEYKADVKREINRATDDAVSRINSIGEKVREGVTAFTDEQRGFVTEGSKQPGGIRIDVKALDVNKDGVVDEKDFELLLQQRQGDK